MRTFIAIEIPKIVKEIIEQFENQLKSEKAKITWVKPDNVHITLKFLGEVEESKIPEIHNTLKICVSKQKPFDIEVAGSGVFPNFTRPRVLWVGLKKGTEELKNIAQSIDNELEKFGFKKEERDFKPHLTIGRVKFIHNPQEFLQKMNSEEFKGEMFTAREILIMKSDLKPTGAIYTKLHIIEFVV